MITCSNCQNANMEGAIFCSECGAPLAVAHSQTVLAASRVGTIASDPHNEAAAPIQPELDNWGTLHLLDTGDMLTLAERNEFTLGRISEGQPIMPDIDLSPYQAYAKGVSRLHAVIKRGPQAVVLMDLGSANGTFVNGKRLNPSVERDLANGDVVALGRLKIQILLKTV